MNNLTRLVANCALNATRYQLSNNTACIKYATQVRGKCKVVEKPKPGAGQQFRRVVHYPKEYTVEPLKISHLAGRDPVTGRVVAKGIGGGIKQKYHWVKWVRDGPAEGPPQEERVLEIIDDGCRTAKVALVGVGDELKYILATENMKKGDIIKTSRVIPRIPVRPNEGDAYPLGALPIGTRIHNLEKNPGYPFHLIHAAGTFGTILRKFDDKVVVQLPSKREFAFDRICMATVGRLSNVEHNKEHIGSAQRMRLLGNRPRSGLWKRKEGKHGRKIRRLPPMSLATPPPKAKDEVIKLTLHL
ncbi:39S ribosomal protein L2, mitochondrial-like isoform X2 [Rhagoletis pomonella]|uniref:39S ribosomal protein L2, mitochondrial-like isoform X2 n=1 Tax=Rhagoletis pomonella TaxID=28610 RepID=UPI00177BDEE4|nr:39S ribosomal protein L2, mitochondrial-like isoform X2 [Rhagoletis pomonella]